MVLIRFVTEILIIIVNILILSEFSTMPTDIHRYMLTSGKQIAYSGDEIQERNSVSYSYWCLYYLLKRQRGRSILETIHNSKFDFSDQSVNHRLITNYFKNRLYVLYKTEIAA